MRKIIVTLALMGYTTLLSMDNMPELVQDSALDLALRSELVAATLKDDDTSLILCLTTSFPLNTPGQNIGVDDPLLCIAAQFDRRSVIEMLLANYDADANVSDGYQCTPLHIAVKKNHIDTVRLLLRGKASLRTKNCWGQTPLHEALESLYPSCEMIRLLLKHGAHINEPDSEGNTVAHIACVLNRQDIFNVLNEYKINWNVTNNEGQLPRELLPLNDEVPDSPPPPPPAIEYTMECDFDQALGNWYTIHTYYALLELCAQDEDECDENYVIEVPESQEEDSSQEDDILRY